MSKKLKDGYEHSITIDFGKTGAEISFANETSPGAMSHAAALMIISLNNRVEGNMQETISGVVDSLKSILDGQK